MILAGIPLKRAKKLRNHSGLVFTLVTNVMIVERGEVTIMLLELHYSEHIDSPYCSRNLVRLPAS